MGNDDIDVEFEQIMASANLDIPTGPPPDVSAMTSVDLIVRQSEIKEALRNTHQINPTTSEGFELHAERLAIKAELERRNLR